MDTLQEAKEHLRKNFKEGTRCPCCGRLVKLYSYQINASLAKALVSLFRLSRRESPSHVKNIVVAAGLPASCGKNFCILKHWGLIDEVRNKDSKKRSSGYWTITPVGEDFILNKLKVSQNVQVYNNKIRDQSQSLVSIIDCLGHGFNYQELMNG